MHLGPRDLIGEQHTEVSAVVCMQVDPDKAFAVQISHDETVVQGPVAYVQCALLYTTSHGERAIR